MKPLVMLLAVSCVRGWTLLYTWGMPSASRESRRAEIESDLWECQCEAAGDDGLGAVLQIVLRLLIGIPDDLGWRVEQAAANNTFTRGSFALCGRAAGVALVLCAVWVIDADASRKRPALVVAAQNAARSQDVSLDAATRAQVIDEALNALNEAYVFPDVAKKMEEAIHAPGLGNEAATTRRNLREELGAAAPSVAAVDSVKAVPASRADESFESGTLANWRTDQAGAGAWFAYANGKTPPDPSRSDANFPFDVPDPPQGKFAAVTDVNGPGRRILYRDITLDGRYLLRLTVFYVSVAPFSAAAISSGNTISDEQQYRIDLVSASAPVDSVVSQHVLATVFQARPNDPPRLQPTEVTFDLSPWAGQTIRLRFAAADNQGPLRAGVDNIRFERR